MGLCMKRTTLWWVLGCFLVLAGCKEVPPSSPSVGMAEGPRADTVVINAKVYTDGSSANVSEALAIQGGRFLAVGTTEAMLALTDDATETIDASGAAVFPGLIDAHAHPSMGGQKVLYMCNFAFNTTPDELAATIERCAQAPDAPEWIVGGQWNSNFFVDHDIASPREFLDAVSGGHPVFLDDDSAHHGWANTLAMELAGIELSADTVDPIGGVYVRDEAGVPNGVLLESAAGVVSAVIPPYTLSQVTAGIEAVSGIANSYGVTAFGDARVPEMAMRAYKAADDAGKFTVHAVLYQQSYGHGGEPEPL